MSSIKKIVEFAEHRKSALLEITKHCHLEEVKDINKRIYEIERIIEFCELLKKKSK